MSIPDKYERDSNDDDKVEGGGGFNHPPAPGPLDQTGNLEPYVLRRTKRPLSDFVLHDLAQPTLIVTTPKVLQLLLSTMTTTTILRGFLFGGIKIAFVAT